MAHNLLVPTYHCSRRSASAAMNIVFTLLQPKRPELIGSDLKTQNLNTRLHWTLKAGNANMISDHTLLYFIFATFVFALFAILLTGKTSAWHHLILKGMVEWSICPCSLVLTWKLLEQKCLRCSCTSPFIILFLEWEHYGLSPFHTYWATTCRLNRD